MTKKILTDLDATGRTITAGIFSGVANNDTINTITGATSTASFWSDVTTGTIGVGTGVTTGTISIGTGLTTGRVDIAVGSGSTPTSTVNINTGKSGSQNVITNIGSGTLGGTINLYTGASGVILNGTALIKTPTAITSGSSIGLSITTGSGALGANSGSVTIDAGQIPTGAGTAGTVLIGNNYATSLTIGRSNITTTINGTLATTSPSITTSLTTPSTSFDLLNTTATTINAFGAATTLTIGAATASTVSIGSAATSVTLGQGSSNLNANKSVNIAGSTGSNAVSTGVTSSLTLNNYYSIIGTSTTYIGGGYSLTGTSTINIGTFSGSVSGTNNITIGSSPGTTTINGTLVASAPAGSLTGTSLPAAITSASGLATVGTITSGTWNGTAITSQYGGTGQSGSSPFTQYGVTYASTATALAQTAAGTAGQVLTSNATSAPTWSDKGYTLISAVAFSGSAPSFTSIPQTYKKLVVQIKFDSIGTFSASCYLTVNNNAVIYATLYSVGSTTATTSATGTDTVIRLTAQSVTPIAGDLMTVEIPNYTGSRPTIWISGGYSASSQTRWGVASTAAAITQVSFGASASWGTGAGTAYLYGVN